MKIVTKILLTAFTLLLIANIVPGVSVDSVTTAIIVALVVGLLNIFIRPILVILTLPITILTMGLFLFVINAGLILVVSSFVSGFHVDGFIPALLSTLILTLVGSLANKIFS